MAEAGSAFEAGTPSEAARDMLVRERPDDTLLGDWVNAAKSSLDPVGATKAERARLDGVCGN